MNEPDRIESPLTTLADVQAALAAALLAALQRGEREIVCCDADFSFWPLNSSPLIDALTHWAAPSRLLVLLARSYDDVVRRHPRFVQWRVTWSHVVDARAPEEEDALSLPSLLLVGRHSVQVFDRERGRGKVSDDAGEARRVREHLDVILQRSSPAFGATTLGL